MKNDVTLAEQVIPAHNVGRVERRVDELNRRAKRLGVAPYRVECSEPWIERYRDEHDKLRSREVVRCTVIGAPVMVGGWAFVAKIDYLDSENALVLKAPDHETLDLSAYAREAPRCDHCRTLRRRLAIYIVQNDVGARKVVGSTCLRDFTGCDRDPERIVALGFEVMRVFGGDDGEFSGGRGSDVERLVDVLAVTAGMIRIYGWCSRKRARDLGADCATADFTSGWIGSDAEDRRKYWPAFEGVTRGDRAVAKRAIHWAVQQIPDNDYIENVVAIARAGYSKPKTHGLACSIVAAWLRHREQLELQARRRKADPDATCGTVGKREIFNVEVVAITAHFSEMYGQRHRVKMVDTVTNAAMIWWTGDSVPQEIEDALPRKIRPASEPAATIAVKATVKKYDSYKGECQTVVSRVAPYTPPPPKVKKPRGKKTTAPSTEVAAA